MKARAKYRIVEGFTDSGYRFFRPEFRFLFFWFCWGGGILQGEVKFSTLGQAQEFIDFKHERRFYPYEPKKVTPSEPEDDVEVIDLDF